MNQSSANSEPTSRTTAFTKFLSCNVQHQQLFSVNAGIPLLDALEQASCFLASADSIITEAAMQCDNGTVWAAAYLVEISKAIIDAAASAAAMENRND